MNPYNNIKLPYNTNPIYDTNRINDSNLTHDSKSYDKNQHYDKLYYDQAVGMNKGSIYRMTYDELG